MAQIQAHEPDAGEGCFTVELTYYKCPPASPSPNSLHGGFLTCSNALTHTEVYLSSLASGSILRANSVNLRLLPSGLPYRTTKGDGPSAGWST